jgi:hypothetical protein
VKHSLIHTIDGGIAVPGNSAIFVQGGLIGQIQADGFRFDGPNTDVPAFDAKKKSIGFTQQANPDGRSMDIG